MLINTPGYSSYAPNSQFAGFDGNIFSKIVSALDPTKKGSVTYQAAAGIVGEENLQAVAQVGRGIRDEVVRGTNNPATGTAYPVDANGRPILPNKGFLGMSMTTTLAIGAAAAIALFLVMRRR